jgi:hypothetical protein
MSSSNEITEFAAEIISQMGSEDRASFDRDAWFEGVSNFQAGMEHLSTDDILDEIERQLAGTKMQQIADALNAKHSTMSGYDMADSGYNHYEHAEDLAAERGFDVDDERHERENNDAHDEIFFDNGWSLVLSAGEWCVSGPDA